MKSSAELAAQYPKKPLYRKYVSKGHQVLGGLAEMRGEIEVFKEEYRLAIQVHQEIAKQLGDQSKLVKRGDWLHEEWILRSGLIEGLRKNECHEEVIEETLACLPVYESLAFWFPEQHHRVWCFAEAKIWLAISLVKTGRIAEAREWLAKAQVDCANAKISEGSELRAEFVRGILAEAEQLLKQSP